MPAFIVEDGSGVTDASSYASVAYADDYIGLNPLNTAWISLGNSEKETYLMWATHILDTIVKWEGCKVDSTYPLAFPRVYMIDREGFLIDSNVVPVPVKQATSFLANQLLTGPDPTSIDDLSHIKQLQVDVIDITFKDSETAQKISKFLRSLLSGLGILQEPGALGFVPIRKA